MERLNIQEYNKIHNRFGFFLSLPTVILVFFHYQFIVPLIKNSEPTLNYLVIFSFILANAILGLFVVNQLVKPVKMHVIDPTNKAIELKAYKNISILPNYALVYLPIVIGFIWSLCSMSFPSMEDQTHAMILELSFLAILTGILYLFANHRITFSLQFFRYQSGFMNISMKKRIGTATFISILSIMVNGIYCFYLTRDNMSSSMAVGIYTLFVLIPCIIFLTDTILKSTIGPAIRILKAWDLMEQNGRVDLPNMCVGEMADLTYRFEHAMQLVQNQLKENTELSQELSGVANDLSTSAEVVSSTAENIASSQQYIAKGAAQQTSAILRIQQKINAVAQGVAITQDKVSHISNISNSIKSIAGQTNILALNAAIEAARAGEAGRGFNVVADQVRKLADESKRAVSNTDSMIKEIETVAGNQKQIMSDLLHEIGELSTIAEETSSSTEEVSASAEEQSASMQQISGSANRIANLASMLIKLKSVTVENVVDEPENIPKVMHITPSDMKNSKVTPKVVIPIESLYNGKSA